MKSLLEIWGWSWNVLVLRVGSWATVEDRRGNSGEVMSKLSALRYPLAHTREGDAEIGVAYPGCEVGNGICCLRILPLGTPGSCRLTISLAEQEKIYIAAPSRFGCGG